MSDESLNFFFSFFSNESLLGNLLAILFGTIWLIPFRSFLFKKYWIWSMFIASALITTLAISFIQVPLQKMIGPVFLGFFQAAISGIVQEAAKLSPVIVFYFLAKDEKKAEDGIVLGAICGAGFGVFEAAWIHNGISASGWSLSWIKQYGFAGVASFVERFFCVGFHTACTALAAYGLFTGRWMRWLLVAVLFHSVLNYLAVLFRFGILGSISVQIGIATISLLAVVCAMWIKRKTYDIHSSQ